MNTNTMVNQTLADLALDLDKIKVDGESVEKLEPATYLKEKAGYQTVEDLARKSGIDSDGPKYSGLHHHCQYSRTC